MDSLAQFAPRFLTVHAAPRNRPSEVARKQYALDAHVLPYFGAYNFTQVNASSVAQWVALLRQQGLAPSSINNLVSLLRQMLAVAAEWGEWPGPAPKFRLLPVVAEEPRWLTQDESAKLLAAMAQIAEPVYVALVNVALHTGLRIGELLAIRKCDVDASTRSLLISGTQERTTNRRQPTKSKRSRRVPLNAPAWISVCLLPPMKDESPPDALLFVDESGIIGYRRAYRLFKQACAHAGLANVTPHTLRHTCASHLAINNVPLHTIGTLLGHSSPTVTHRYAHLSLKATREAVETLPTFNANLPADAYLSLASPRKH